jgi:hypothetical protein
MNPGDIVFPMFKQTNTGIPVPMGMCKLLEKVGTVPNFWKVERLDPSCTGAIVKAFVYPEDELRAKEKESKGINLTVINGGKSGA